MVKRSAVFCMFLLVTWGFAWADLSECSKISSPDKKN